MDLHAFQPRISFKRPNLVEGDWCLSVIDLIRWIVQKIAAATCKICGALKQKNNSSMALGSFHDIFPPASEAAPRHHGTRGTGHRAQFQFHWPLKNVYGYGGWLRKAASPRCLKVHRVSLSIRGPSFSGKFENELLKEPTIVSSYWIQKISPAIIMWQFLNPSIIFPRISFSVQWITT